MYLIKVNLSNPATQEKFIVDAPDRPMAMHQFSAWARKQPDGYYGRIKSFTVEEYHGFDE